MSELLDVFDDEGLLDSETRTFLVEALSNSERDEWRDILEPFVRPEPALAVLESVPNVLTRSLRALAPPEDSAGCVAGPSACCLAFLTCLHKVLGLSGLHTAALCSQLCSAAAASGAESTLWMSRAESTCAHWKLTLPTAEDGTWRQKFFKLLRPRYDGVYVGECGFNRWVPTGHHLDMRKNAASLASDGGRGGKYQWVTYRRYLRLVPPHWALVLQDPCPRAAAVQALVTGVDLENHMNQGKSERVISDVDRDASDKETLRKRICLGRFDFAPATSTIELRYTAAEGEFHVVFKLSHQGPHGFADRLEWATYTRTDQSSEVLDYSLGKLPDWKGGGLVDSGKDHFPCMDLRPCPFLEHHLK